MAAVTYPDDLTGDVLRNIQANGSDMLKPMLIDFQIEAKLQESLKPVREELSKLNGDIHQNYDDEYMIWTLYYEVEMMPDHRIIVDLENKLYTICNKLDAEYVGFGSFGNSNSPK